MSKWIQRAPSPNGEQTVTPGEDILGQEYPALVEFLTLFQWDDGEPRVPGTLLLCVEGARWRAWLHDRDSEPERSAWVSEETLTALVDAVERKLREGGLEWRIHRKQNSGRRGKGG